MHSPHLTHHIQPFVISTFTSSNQFENGIFPAFYISTPGNSLQLQTFLVLLLTLCEHNYRLNFIFKFFIRLVNGWLFFSQHNIDSTFIVFSQHAGYIVDDGVVCDFWLCCFNWFGVVVTIQIQSEKFLCLFFSSQFDLILLCTRFQASKMRRMERKKFSIIHILGRRQTASKEKKNSTKYFSF